MMREVRLGERCGVYQPPLACVRFDVGASGGKPVHCTPRRLEERPRLLDLKYNDQGVDE